MHAACRLTRTGVDDVVIAGAVLIKISLVVTGRRYRFILQRHGNRDLTINPRISNADYPGPSKPVAEQSGIPARCHDRISYAFGSKNANASFNDVAFGNAPEIDAYALLSISNTACRRIQNHVPIIDIFKLGLDGDVVGTLTCSEVIVLPDTLISNVERPLCQSRYFQRTRNQVEQFLSGSNGAIRRFAVDFRDFAIISIRTHESVNTTRLLKNTL